MRCTPLPALAAVTAQSTCFEPPRASAAAPPRCCSCRPQATRASRARTTTTTAKAPARRTRRTRRARRTGPRPETRARQCKRLARSDAGGGVAGLPLLLRPAAPTRTSTTAGRTGWWPSGRRLPRLARRFLLYLRFRLLLQPRLRLNPARRFRPRGLARAPRDASLRRLPGRRLRQTPPRRRPRPCWRAASRRCSDWSSGPTWSAPWSN